MLKPGKLPIAGDSSPFDDSLAEAIEDQLNALLTQPLPKDDSQETRDRRKLFVAIARGVIEHLNANAASIRIDLGGGVVLTPTFTIDWGPA